MKRYRLTESRLRGMIREAVKNVLREADENSYGGDGNFRHDYRIGAHGYVTGSVNMPDDKIKDPSNVRWRNPYVGDTDSNRMHKDLEDMNKKERNNMRRADKRWQKSADSRPLHRKGAAQRDLMDDVNEGIVRRMIREAVRNALNENNWQKPANWKDTEWKGTYEDEDGAIYMPDDDIPKDIDGNIYDKIDSMLSQIDDNVYVSRFYSDENQITIAAHKNIGGEGRKEVINIMKEFGYDLYTTGANDDFIMMTFN